MKNLTNEQLLNMYAIIVAQNAQRKKPAIKKEEQYKKELLKRLNK